MKTNENLVDRWNEVQETFSYSIEDQNTFPYIREYVQRISSRFADVSKDAKQIRRFMLAGLFLTYRACNHMGENISTKNASLNEAFGSRQLYYFKLWCGEEIKDTLDYLAKLRYVRLLITGFIFGYGRALTWFVLSG